jgi:hypothetical protein
MNTRRQCLAALLGGALPGLGLPAHAQTPSLQAATVARRNLDRRRARQRDVPVRLRWPDAARFAGPWPVVIFSHGLGGTREGGTVWGEAWADGGLCRCASCSTRAAIWRPCAASRTPSPTSARCVLWPGLSKLLARLRDVGFALDEIGRRHAAGQGQWGHVRPTQAGMAGHSFGAHTTMGMAGQRYPGFEGIAEPRLAAFIAFSPTAPVMGDAHRAFERLNRPLLSITGTRDDDVVAWAPRPSGAWPSLPLCQMETRRTWCCRTRTT